jgi:hypothetical protein
MRPTAVCCQCNWEMAVRSKSLADRRKVVDAAMSHWEDFHHNIDFENWLRVKRKSDIVLSDVTDGQ